MSFSSKDPLKDPFQPAMGHPLPGNPARDSKIRQVELQAMFEDLDAGAQYQASLFPKSSPPMAGYDLAAFNRPARTLSGDFFDYVALDDKKLGVVIADASGKGIPA